MSIVANKASQTAQRLSRLLDVPTGQIEAFLETFRAVPQARKNPLHLTNKSELFVFYKSWLPLLIDEISSEDNGDIISDIYVVFSNLDGIIELIN